MQSDKDWSWRPKRPLQGPARYKAGPRRGVAYMHPDSRDVDPAYKTDLQIYQAEKALKMKHAKRAEQRWQSRLSYDNWADQTGEADPDEEPDTSGYPVVPRPTTPYKRAWLGQPSRQIRTNAEAELAMLYRGGIKSRSNRLYDIRGRKTTPETYFEPGVKLTAEEYHAPVMHPELGDVSQYPVMDGPDYNDEFGMEG